MNVTKRNAWLNTQIRNSQILTKLENITKKII